MKSTIKIILFLGVLFAASCTEPTDMLTVINPDGSCYREFSANAHRDFIEGDTAGKNNPFPVEIDSTCSISWRFRNSDWYTKYPADSIMTDSVMRKTEFKNREPQDVDKSTDYEVVIRMYFKSVQDMADKFKLKKSHEWSNMKVKYLLEKKFRWFYTYYIYRETYPVIKTGFELPIENYMTNDEAQFWFTGKPNILQGMNGLEIREYVGKIEDNYNKWVIQNLWNAEYKVLLNNYDQLSEKPVTKKEMQSLRDSIFFSKVNYNQDFDMKKALNSFFETEVFSELWEGDNSSLAKFEKDIDKKFTFLFSQSFNYKLILPGKITQMGDAVVRGDTLVWKLSSYRLIPADYVIEAQSRKANVWAFILTGIILLVAVGSFVWKPKR